MAKTLNSIHDVVRQYASERENYAALANYVAELVRRSSPRGLIHKVEHRAKEISSFEQKCQKTNEDGSLRYPNAPDGITDLSGVRIIVFTRESVNIACDLIAQLFNVFELEDVGDRVYQEGRFGYQSKHILLRLGEDRRNLRENQDFSSLVCEVQVRTILQHAWAELEHDIQYKSARDIPLDLSKRFSALAGLLELADREFQNIQNESAAAKDKVKAGLLSDLTKEGFSQRDSGHSEPEQRADTVRELIAVGRIADAIKLFDRKIESNPSSYTHYIGRAKTHFLAGDVRSAVSDLTAADKLAGNRQHTAALWQLIETGDTKQVEASYYVDPLQVAREQKGAIAALTAGDGIRAFEHYDAIQDSHYSRATARFGKAMCCTLERDVDGAGRFLSELEIRPGTPMAVNIYALKLILSILSHEDTSDQMAELRNALEQLPQYTLAASQLSAFLEGVRRKKYPEQKKISAVENLLSNHIIGTSAGAGLD